MPPVLQSPRPRVAAVGLFRPVSRRKRCRSFPSSPKKKHAEPAPLFFFGARALRTK